MEATEDEVPPVCNEIVQCLIQKFCIFDELPPEVSHHLVTEYLDLPSAFTVFWETFDLPEDYEKPPEKDWKWVAMSKMPFTAEDFTGVGSLTRSDGVYEGDFVDGKFNGKGLFKWRDADYWGDWKDGLCWGFGVMKWKSKHKYEGNWKKGKQKGHGVFWFSNGDKYDGNWKKGKREGYGVFYWSTKDRYEGEWKEGYRDGKGKFIWENGDSYDGEWKVGARQGMGVLLWANGERYSGEWKGDDRTGIGSFYWSNGDVYEGEWKDSAQCGQGKLVWGNGNSFVGEWKEGNKFDGILFEKASGASFHRCEDEENLKVDYKYVHPSVKNALLNNKCSYTVTGTKCYFQYLYKTRDNDDRTHGVCLACYQKCIPHYAFPLYSQKMFYGGNFYCDCGSGNLAGVKCLCTH